jgi:hypothetical protein
MRILIVERTVQFDRKVGESTSEVAGCFLTRVLHQGTHLSARTTRSTACACGSAKRRRIR